MIRVARVGPREPVALIGPFRKSEARRVLCITVMVMAVVEENLGLARAIARDYWGRIPRHVTLEDLESEALYGLWEASRVYDASRGVPFAGFARLVIHRAITRYLRAAVASPTRRPPASPSSDSGDLWEAVESLRDEEREIVLRVYGMDGHEPESLRKLAQRLGWSNARASRAHVRAIRSLHRILVPAVAETTPPRAPFPGRPPDAGDAL